VIKAASNPDAPVTVFGTDYPTADGTCVRDYIHVQDLARAHIMGLQYLEEERAVVAFNLGTGRGHSVREIIDATKRVTGREVSMRFGLRRPGDPPELVADATAARTVLRWQPEYVEIDAIIETAWRWHNRRIAT
jgi:UDP-glucose 4-epimerase